MNEKGCSEVKNFWNTPSYCIETGPFGTAAN